VSQLVGGHFTAAGYSVAFNDPYKGGFITAHHGQPQESIHAIQIELRRDLYMDETAYTLKDAGFTRLRTTLTALLAKLETFRP
jgi:N-formylglutamate amidohydrolase